MYRDILEKVMLGESVESAFGNTNNVQAPETPDMPWISPDSVGLGILKESDESEMNKLDSAMLNVEAYALSESFALDFAEKNNENLSESVNVEERREKIYQLQEAGITDYWNKFIKLIKDAWAKMKAWFSNLFKSIAVSCTNVKKALKGVDKILNPKNFNDFTYNGHEWRDSSMPSTLESNIAKLGKEFTSDLNKIKTKIKITNRHLSDKDNDEIIEKKDQEKFEDITADSNRRNYIARLIGSSGQKTIEQAKDAINVSYGYDQSKEIKGLSNWKGMVTFLENFENNKVLKDAQKACDDNYAELLKNAEEIKSFGESKRDEVPNDASGKRMNDSRFNVIIRKAQAIISINKSIISDYDTLMGQCININKARFGEYRSVISKAIRYKSK